MMVAKPTFPMMPARSSLRMATMVQPGRRRRYMLRFALLALALAILTTLVWLVYSRIFAPNSAVRPLYWLHDNIYLPLYGRMWTALFPYSMLWMVPLLLLILLLIGELLLPYSPVRAAHRWLVRSLIALPIGRQIIAFLPGGFSRRVIDEVLATGLGDTMLVRNALTATSPGQLTRLSRLIALRWHLSPRGTLDELAVFEALALMRLRAYPNYASIAPLTKLAEKLATTAVYAKGFTRLLSDDNAAETATAAFTFLAKVNTPPEHLADVEETPLEFAMLAVRVSLLGARRLSPSGGMFFAAWARAMTDITRPTLAARLTEAQRLIKFEFWAAITDHPRRVAPFEDALAQALLTHPETPDRGEHFAWRGEV